MVGRQDPATDLAASLWWNQVDPPVARPSLDGDRRVDAVIVGTGYTGLWTAHSILSADPTVSVCVIDAERVGFGASEGKLITMTASSAGTTLRFMPPLTVSADEIDVALAALDKALIDAS